MSVIADWAARWQLHPQALAEFYALLYAPTVVQVTEAPEGSEAGAQQRTRLAAPRIGAHLWRNNSGAHEDEYGNHVRYGLCNDSKKVNKHTKSSDLIGITPIGGRGIFTAAEVKPEGWVYSGTPREKAQLNYLNIVQACGGIATFATGPQDYLNAVEKYKNGQT